MQHGKTGAATVRYRTYNPKAAQPSNVLGALLLLLVGNTAQQVRVRVRVRVQELRRIRARLGARRRGAHDGLLHARQPRDRRVVEPQVRLHERGRRQREPLVQRDVLHAVCARGGGGC